MGEDSVSLLLGCTQAIALTMSVAFLVYVCVIIVPYLRHKPSPPGDAATFDWHFLVPCRDEEAVIGGTVRYLRTVFPHAHIWVVDDDSDDRTAEVVRSLSDGSWLHLVQRRRPAARTGKGDALNAAYRELKTWLGRHSDAHRRIVVVVDADGRPAANCLDVCAGATLFGDDRIGAVQIDVRMSNRGVAPPSVRGWRRRLGTMMVRMQDLEFRTAIAAIQKSRGYTGTISMGGNGQFARLSALDTIAGRDPTDPARRPDDRGSGVDVALVHGRGVGAVRGLRLVRRAAVPGLGPDLLVEVRAAGRFPAGAGLRRVLRGVHLHVLHHVMASGDPVGARP